MRLLQPESRFSMEPGGLYLELESLLWRGRGKALPLKNQTRTPFYALGYNVKPGWFPVCKA